MFLIFLALGCSARGALAADWYVRSNSTSYGSGAGTDWNNAFSGFSSINWGSVSCGDTIWVAGGNYTQNLIPNESCTSSTRLYIRRARSDESKVTSAPGWSSSFDSTVHQTAGIQFGGSQNYIVISGRTTKSGGSNGWWIDRRGRTSATGVVWHNGSDASYVTIEYMDVQGPGKIVYTGDGRGLDLTPFTSAYGNTFSHMKIWDWESAIYNVGIHGTTFEYIEMFDIMATNWSSFHPNGIYISSSTNGTIRYSRFYGNNYPVGEGIFFEQAGGASNWKIYGNVFHDITVTGTKAIEVTSVVNGLQVYNNTFDNVKLPWYVSNGGGCGSGSAFRNNLSVDSGGFPSSCGNKSNNIKISSSPVPFVNRSAHDYRIVANTGGSYPRNAGVNLSSLFSKDANGGTFGGDGTWDVGAFEYSDGTQGPSTPEPLAIPSGLKEVIE